MLEFLKKQLDRLLEERGALKTGLDGIIAGPSAEKRDLNDAEQSAFDEARAAVIAKDGEIDAMSQRVKDAEADEARAAKVAELRAQTAAPNPDGETPARSGGAVITSEKRTYGDRDKRGRLVNADPKVSFVRDMFTIATNGPDLPAATERLMRNNQEARALTTVAGAGGEFAPPAWLVAEFVTLARAARPTADRVQNQALPMGISSVNIPKLLTGTATAAQAVQNTSVQSTDATTGSVTAAIVTIAGQQVVSQQLLDQSGVNIDDILLQDLMFDYAAKVDLFVLNNNATNAKGLLQQAGVTATTYTRTLAAGDTAALYAQIAGTIAAIQAVRFLPPDTIIMHPRRWAAFVAASDTTGRPLLSPVAGAFNAPGTADRSYAAQGPVGSIAGLDVITDPQIPTNTGVGTNQDTVIVMRAADSILWEGDLKSEAFRETKADQLSVLLRVYNYAAFTSNRYAASVGLITGTGLIPPVYGN